MPLLTATSLAAANVESALHHTDGGRQQSQATSTLATVQRTTSHQGCLTHACMPQLSRPSHTLLPGTNGVSLQHTHQPLVQGMRAALGGFPPSLRHISFFLSFLLGVRVASAYLWCCRCRATGAASCRRSGRVRAGHGAPREATLAWWQSCCRWCWWCCWRMRCLCWCRAAWHGMLHAGWCGAGCRALHGERPAGMCMHAKAHL